MGERQQATHRHISQARSFSGSKADARVCGVKDGVVVFEELLANDVGDAGGATV